MWYKTSNRKPYYSLGDSMRKFFSEPVRFIRESNTMESAFEKPYLEDGGYNKMHLRWNIPDWEFGFDSRGGGEGGSRRRLGSCTEYNRPPNCNLSVDDDGVVTGTISDTNTKTGHLQNFSLTVNNPNYATPGGISAQGDKDTAHVYNIQGKISFTDDCVGGVRVCAEFESCENFCSQHGFPANPGCASRTCCTWAPCSSGCDPEIVVTLDPDCTDVTTQEAAFSVSVLSGTPPFTWSADQAVMDEVITETRSNTGTTDTNTCGIVTITVTDDCDTSVEIFLRVTDNGSWTAWVTGCKFPGRVIIYDSGGPGCFTDVCGDKTSPAQELIEGKYWQRDCFVNRTWNQDHVDCPENYATIPCEAGYNCLEIDEEVLWSSENGYDYWQTAYACKEISYRTEADYHQPDAYRFREWEC